MCAYVTGEILAIGHVREPAGGSEALWDPPANHGNDREAG